MKSTRAVPLLVVASLGLAACEEGQLVTAPTDGADAAAPAEPRVEIQEIERADIFSTSELALWDGRPSLGGLWVAHPDVTDPERVLIRNTTNGRTTFGALFRRERNNPGPRIQVSSDAAAELGILAGQPTELDIVVIRREEVVIEPAPLPVAEPEELPETEDLPEDEEATEALAATDDETTTEEEPPKRQGFFARLFGGGAAADEVAEDDAVAVSDDASAPEVEIAPLDPITTSAAAAIDAAEAAASAPSNVRPVARTSVAAVPAPAPTPEPEPEPVVVAAPEPEPAPAPTPAPQSLNNPFVQVGLFSVEANASAAASSLRQGGIVPTVVPGTNANGTFWRVLVGPMTSPDDQAEILGQVKALGYADAFLVSN